MSDWRPGGWADGPEGRRWRRCTKCASAGMCAGWGRCEQAILRAAVEKCSTCKDPKACAADGCAAHRDVLRGRAA